MPQLKQPVQLFDGALATLNYFIIKLCKKIQRSYGKYSELKFQEAVQEIQDYLLAYLPFQLLETLCSKIHLMCRGSNYYIDSRLISSIFLHENCQKFNPKFELVPDSVFWKSKICMLKKIVVLNLKMVCTDDILEVVGANCKSLEYINIVSRASSWSNSTNNFNALKLQFFVSDNGLKFLSQCKNLRKIEMMKVVRSQCAGSKITHIGISFLLKSLPKLESISYSDMGCVIDEIDSVDSLSLTSINDCHPKPQRILKISSLCPHLTGLFLHLPVDDLSDSEKLGDAILVELCKSNLRLRCLNLNNFPLNDSFENFIIEKGKHLTDLSLSKHVTVSGTIDPVILGFNCQNLECLYLKGVGIKCIDPDDIDNELMKFLYVNLKALLIDNKFSGDIGFLCILPVFLKHAKNIMSIDLGNYGKADYIDKVLESIMKYNPLIKLRKANFSRGSLLSFKFLQEFTFHCPKLNHITVHESRLLTEGNVEDFKRYLKAINYNINIYFIIYMCA